MESLDHKKAKEDFAKHLTEAGGIKTQRVKDVKSELLEDSKKEISAIKTRLEHVEKILSNLLSSEKSQNAQQNIFHERKHPAENVDDVSLDMKKVEKKEHAEINALRSEIATIERQLRLLEISAALRVELNDDLKKKRERVNDLIKSISNTSVSTNL